MTRKTDEFDRERDRREAEDEGDSNWVQARRYVFSELSRLTRENERIYNEIDSLVKSLNAALVALAVLQTKAMMLGFFGGLIATAIIQYLFKKV